MGTLKPIKVALIGNPNTGKTSLFNQLTGLKQKVGNYPGVTVDKKQGTCKLPNKQIAIITDLPGTYSINPTSVDESIVLKSLLTVDDETYPDVIVVVADIENLKRNLFLFSQVKDLEIPIIL
ncbi:MAG: 50S ribosome-binding GTPase, partial [Flavobacteriaceae bacterium]|nr:50S ribosome-binding GTPase [Flavobacteriaceae bacterium]